MELGLEQRLRLLPPAVKTSETSASSVRAGGRAAPAGVPDPGLVEHAERRTFTADYKARILAEAEACMRPGGIG